MARRRIQRAPVRLDRDDESAGSTTMQRASHGRRIDASIAALQKKADASARVEAVPVVGGGQGIPSGLRGGLEALSGVDLSGVRVHYNSSKPASLQAHAYAQGTDIHLGPGQERHLPHEGWHTIQQMQGRVRPTMSAGGVPINDHPSLEKEADRMGARASRMKDASS